jgi:CBS domain containing-hemolysin-like protein
MQWLIWGLYPLVLLSQKITQLIAGNGYSPVIKREEFKALADLGVEEGVVLEAESRILKSLMRFGSLKAKDVMTPRSVLFTLPEDMTTEEILANSLELRFSRIPVHPREGEGIGHYVLKNDILLSAARNEKEKKLAQLARRILIVPESTSLVSLFDMLLDRREHIALVVDEYGGISGIVTMEDILETVVGVEIVDETDKTIDMQHLARERWEKRAKEMGLILSDSEDPSS